jgi:hypothetical protein
MTVAIEEPIAVSEIPQTYARPHRSPAEFIALGRRDEPRWLVPADYSPGEDDFLGWSPFRKSSQLAWAGMRAALRWGGAAGLALLGKRLEWAMNFDWQALGWCKQNPPVPLIYLGTPGERRKAVFHLLDRRSGVCDLIVKVPLTGAAAEAIAHEATVLGELERQGFAAAPRLVQFDRRRGVSSQTVVRGVRCRMELCREAAWLLRELHLDGPQISLRDAAAATHALMQRGDFDSAEEALFTRALEAIDDSTPRPAVRIHGDFAPWNIKVNEQGSSALVDWEASEPKGLPLHDAYHFVHMTHCLFGRRPQTAYQQMRFRPSVTVEPGVSHKLEIAYLVRSCVEQRQRRNRKYADYLAAVLRLALELRA